MKFSNNLGNDIPYAQTYIEILLLNVNIGWRKLFKLHYRRKTSGKFYYFIVLVNVINAHFKACPAVLLNASAGSLMIKLIFLEQNQRHCAEILWAQWGTLAFSHTGGCVYTMTREHSILSHVKIPLSVMNIIRINTIMYCFKEEKQVLSFWKVDPVLYHSDELLCRSVSFGLYM